MSDLLTLQEAMTVSLPHSERVIADQLIDAIWPVLIPVEQQDIAIQRENFIRINRAALAALMAYKESFQS